MRAQRRRARSPPFRSAAKPCASRPRPAPFRRRSSFCVGIEILLHAAGAHVLRQLPPTAQIGGDELHALVGFDAQAADHRGNLLVDGFARHQFRHAARNVVLQGDAEDAADQNHREDPHQDRGQAVPPVKTGVHQDQQEAQQSQPDVRREPCLHLAQRRCRIPLAQAEQTFEDDDAGSQRGEEQARHGTAARPLGESIGINNVDGQRDQRGDSRARPPTGIAGDRGSLRPVPARNSICISPISMTSPGCNSISVIGIAVDQRAVGGIQVAQHEAAALAYNHGLRARHQRSRRRKR